MRTHCNNLMVGLASVGILSCSSAATPADLADPSGNDDPWVYEYQAPEDTGDGWQTTSLAEVEMSEDALTRLMTDLHGTLAHELHSLIVIRRGRLVFEEYFPGRMFNLGQYTGGTGFVRNDFHNLASATKSFTSTLVGIAIDQGLIPSVHSRVFDFFPEHSELVAEDPRRGDMTIQDLLLMRSGIEWHDLGEYDYSDPRNDLVQMFTSRDPIGYILSRNLEVAPGRVFDYCNANTNILGEIVRRTTGSGLDQFSRTDLFQPMGVVAFEWQMISENMVFASGDLRLRPRDMARLGQLFLGMGVWDGQEIVSEEWVEAASTRHISLDPGGWGENGYGYGWWHWDLPSEGHQYESYQASGWGGQWIVVIPELDMVVASTGGNYFQAEPLPLRRILTEYLIPAVH